MNLQLRNFVLLMTNPDDNKLGSGSCYQWINRKSRVGSTPPLLDHHTENSVSSSSCWLGEALTSEGEQHASTRGTTFAASQQSQYLESIDNIILQDQRTAFVALLRACAKNKDLLRGTKIHEEISRRNLTKECSDALVCMYAKCGALAEAKALLDLHKSVKVFPWTALIAGYAREGCAEDALHCFDNMRYHAVPPDAVTYACILKACGTIGALEMGREVHTQLLRRDFLQNDIILSSALVDMYAKCGALSKARHMLEELPSCNVIAWSSLMSSYVKQGQGDQALQCFEYMQQESISPDAVTYACVLRACGAIGARDRGQQIHDEIVRHGFLNNHITLGNALIDMYAKCGVVSKAQCVLEELPSRDVVSYNTLIMGLTKHGKAKQALSFLRRMQNEGIPPDVVTYLCIIKACGSMKQIKTGISIHDEIAKKGLLQIYIVLGNALVDMYAKCGLLAKARSTLENLMSRDVVSWNALITGYAQQGQGQQALECFKLMQNEGISPNLVSYVCGLKACGSIGVMDKGERIHKTIVKEGLLQNHIALGNALVDMYAKCGAILMAESALRGLPSRDVVSWNALIAGYVQEGQGEQAVTCFECMQREGISPDALTFTCILKACSIMGALDKGEEIHDEILRQGMLQGHLVLGNALIDMYAKCGALFKAHHVLDELPSRDVVSWNALIAGYAQLGQGEQALACLEGMQCEGIPPDVVTLGSVINVCSHLGLLEKGHDYFATMTTKYGVKPNLECFTSMIDLCGRAGHPENAIELIKEIPSAKYSALWHALLGACQKWGNVFVGRWAFERAVQFDRNDGPAYVLMANIHVTAGMQEDVEQS